ncbi:putative rhamnogalacturonate lyase C [Daldinia childiae]|uniref:putative rhamnogalacturonate lyase C n=1 Tax=Daldinia childiae TaxID=326645 RepID=UPI001447C826|nr:putative rhamnogalacturonate lyase C [Daldinia childiae]KAF3062421.1 putative rhamnogalacturonate lyase C [Daldinia childiae]
MVSLKALAFAILASRAKALLEATETTSQYILRNDDLSVAVSKSNGAVSQLSLGKQDLIGAGSGRGPYLDCSCIPSGFWTPGGTARFKLIKGTDSTGTPYGGVVMSDTYASTNQTLEQYWFLREGETGLHMFSRVTYFNQKTPFLRGLGELRTLFRPSTKLWTHLSGSEGNWAPIPSADAAGKAITVQDATTYLGNSTNDPYVKQYSDYFTKYTFAEVWRDHDVHGQYSDGSTSSDGNTYGAWLVHNTRETYYGGPLHSDLVVDGIVYNYLVAGHHGAPVPNITHGFDRTWGPQYYHFNKGGPKTTLAELRADAAQYANPEWNSEFYDSIAQYVPNYAPSSKRTTFKATIELPAGAKRPLAVLAENKRDFQLNVFDQSSLQYWADINPNTGVVEIPRVKEGTYRLTVYADGIFGWFIQDDVKVSKSGNSTPFKFQWKPESAGKEIWRIGIPDKSAGEYKHGYAPDTSKPLQPEQYRVYWANWDFPTDFPDGVRFKIGESKEAEDFNYIHWSVFPGKSNFFRSQPYYENVNNWTVQFNLTGNQLAGAKKATLTIDLAGVKTANGNSKWADLPNEKYSNVPYTVAANGRDVETWIIPSYRSGSCGVRSSVVCQNFGKKFEFSTGLLKEGVNELVLSLPFNATNTETALLPGTIYLQYDALRFELS